jgi:hypothetical protein
MVVIWIYFQNIVLKIELLELGVGGEAIARRFGQNNEAHCLGTRMKAQGFVFSGAGLGVI